MAKAFDRPSWSRTASGPLYPLVYGRRDGAEARAQIRALLGPRLLGAAARAGARVGEGPQNGAGPGEGPEPARRTRVLDAGCGPGRHLAALAAEGWAAVGLDRSPAALARARRLAAGPLVRADLGRLPLRPRTLDLVLSLFSAFAHDGRSSAPGQLAEFARCLRPGGRLVLDLPEPGAVRQGLVPRSIRRIGGLELRERRRLGPLGASVHKRVDLRRGRFPVARWFEHLPLFEAEELADLLAAAGLEPLHLGPPDAGLGLGPGRLLAVARRRADPGSLS